MSTSISSLQVLDGVVTDYIRFKESRRLRCLDLIEEVVDNWIDTQNHITESNRMLGVSFNPFSRLKINETAHSRILGDLLNPSGSHGQGALFLDAFLLHLKVPYLGLGVWNVTVETGRVDIMLWRESPKSAVIIENKSNNAGDQLNQIYRYWHQQLYLWDPRRWDSKLDEDQCMRNRMFHLIYLPTDGGKAPAQHSLERPEGLAAVNPHKVVPLECKILPLSSLMDLWMNEAFPLIPPTNAPLRAFLGKYKELWPS